jgi:hypothetical protein
LLDKLFPAANIQLRPNQVNERLDVLILTQGSGSKSDLNMSQNRITDLLAFFGREPLGFIKDDKTPGHFLEPLICLRDFTGFGIEFAFQIRISRNENMTFLVPDIV